MNNFNVFSGLVLVSKTQSTKSLLTYDILKIIVDAVAMKIYLNSYSQDSKKSFLSVTVKTLVSSICYHIKFEIVIKCNVMHLYCKQISSWNVFEFLRLYYLNRHHGLIVTKSRANPLAALLERTQCWTRGSLPSPHNFLQRRQIASTQVSSPGQGRVYRTWEWCDEWESLLALLLLSI